ncbi:MAG TPA: hypothetical protein VF195_03865 [Actinomycetota bacterium]
MQGLPVFLDANTPITLGAGTDQDLIIVARFSDDLLFEDPVPTVAVDEGVLSANLQVRILYLGYVAFTSLDTPRRTALSRGLVSRPQLSELS